MICWLQPSSGLSGDMLLGALLDAGADLEQVRAAVAATGLTGWSLTTERVVVDGIRATKAVVGVEDDATHRRAATVLDLVRHAEPASVGEVAARAVSAIAEVEGALHDKDPAHVVLHEIGGHDTVVDTVGVAAALHSLGVTAVHSAPLGLGSGSVRTAHGVLPAPAPATAQLLVGAATVGIDVAGETVTPTGAALVQAVGTRFDPPPAMTVRAVGRGAGTKRFPGRPNVLQVVIGEPVGTGVGAGGPGVPGISADRTVETLVHLETNLDDVTGELLGHLVGAALAGGARDAWATPVVMKKGRPAHTLALLVDADGVDRWTAWLLRETGTLGVRSTSVVRSSVPRTWTEVDVDGHVVRVKHGPWGAKPEHDDVVAVAAATGRTWRDVAERARAAGVPG
ncbi:nickel pincer cofactor biosynthesis protein LarC [Nocardioides zeae]|uniref:Nickel pincer cofactor biosynthesis protein LarC n=1 Tax=Nocardioides imazamoxiresistens TaxID=3231893 RepID=A0ABU3PY30_9ACTN|nr:nickel pincer cofactor biosynthesis protein LarC [Nocardioides zeae]MDT9594091.1 nickel pincer cofactor biosynthesis protein LarC [Nocardioides zeae]